MTKTFNKDSIIPIEGGYVVVDKEVSLLDKKEGEDIGMVIYPNSGKIIRCNDAWATGYNNFAHPIIASIGKRIEGVPLIEEVDEWKTVIKSVFPNLYKLDRDFIRHTEDGFMEGYKAAQSKGQYSEEDIVKAIKFGKELYRDIILKGISGGREGGTVSIGDFMKSLQPKRIPVSVELEMEILRCATNKIGCDCISGCENPLYTLKITSPETNTIIPIKIEYRISYKK